MVWDGGTYNWIEWKAVTAVSPLRATYLAHEESACSIDLERYMHAINSIQFAWSIYVIFMKIQFSLQSLPEASSLSILKLQMMKIGFLLMTGKEDLGGWECCNIIASSLAGSIWDPASHGICIFHGAFSSRLVMAAKESEAEASFN